MQQMSQDAFLLDQQSVDEQLQFYFMKGSLYANPTFNRKNIRQPTVILTRPLVAYDQSRLYFNNLSIKWQAKDIVNCTYSTVYKVLLILSDGCKIYVYTEHLELITHLNNWEPKYIVGFELLEDLNQMLLIGTTEVEVMKVNVVSNVKKTKFLSSMKFNIKKQVHLAVEPHNKLKWNKGYGYILSEDLLYVWSLQDIYFYSLQKLTIRTKAANITKKQFSITTVYFSNYYKYTISGLLNGQIKVWRISINPIFDHKQILIHSFAHHSKQVEQIIKGENEKSIITLGLDLYVCFMSIETFELLRVFNFVGQYSKIYLYDHLFAYAIKDNYLGELNYGQNVEFITEITGAPISYDYSKEKKDNHSKLLLTLSSNLGIELDLNQLHTANQTNKIQLTHIYPPLKSKNVAQIISCPFLINSYYMLVEDGDVFHVKLDNHVAKIDQHFTISKISDLENHQLNQYGTYLAFLNLLPPQIDTEIIQKVIDQDYNYTEGQRLARHKQAKLLAIGCNKGSIIFVSIEDMENIHTRITFHRDKIMNFQEIHNKQSNQFWLVSACCEHYLKIVNFKGGRASCLFSIYFGQLSISMYGFEEYLVVIFDKGIFEISKFKQIEQQPTIIINRESINHEDDIVTITYRHDLKLFLSGAKDNKIKIWTTYKVMLYEIVLDQMLMYCMWGGFMNVIAVQNHNLCCLRNIPFSINEKEIEKYNIQFELTYLVDDEIPLTKYIDQALFKKKERKFKIRSIKPQSLYDSPNIKQKQQQQSKEYVTSIKKKKSKSLNKSAVLSDRTSLKTKRKIFKTEESEANMDKIRQQNDNQAVKKHLQEMANLKKQTNQFQFPKITTKNEDIFVQFMRQKLLNKKLLTRRDITLNRIILKNLIKDHVKGDYQQIKNARTQ